MDVVKIKKSGFLFCLVMSLSCILANLVLLSDSAVWSQEQNPVDNVNKEESKKPKVEVTIIESEIGLDQIQEPETKLSIKPRATFSQFEKTDGDGAPQDISDIELNEEEIIQANRSLRKVIEENEKLRKEYDDLDRQLKNIRGQRNIEMNKMNTMKIERDSYKMQNNKILGLSDRYKKEIETLSSKIAKKEMEMNAKENVIESYLAQEEQSPAAPRGKEASPVYATKAILQDQDKGLNVIAMLDSLTTQNEKLKSDEGKVHYNMGNLFFKQGKYEKASHEYAKAVELMPQDSSAHFNLAFVSSDYLNDPHTALKHYKQYLFLNPHAEDATLVQEKILNAELLLKTELNSGLEKVLRREMNSVYSQ